MNANPPDNQTSPDSVPAETVDDKARRIKTYLLNLARRAEAKEEAAQTIANILAGRIADNWQPALQAAMQASESLACGYVHPVIDVAIAKSLRDKPDLQLVSDLYNRIPLDTISLKQTGLEVFRQTVRAMEERERVELYPVQYATLALNLVSRLSQVGEDAEADVVAKKIMDFCRARYPAEPRQFQEVLANSLESCAMTSASLGQIQKSREMREEAINLWRSVSGSERNLAQSLNNLAGTLKVLDDFTGALKASQESVDIYRGLVDQRKNEQPANYAAGLEPWMDDQRPQFGQALVGLSSHQNDLKLHQECFASAKEAYDLFQSLSGDYPDQFRFHLGMAVHNLGMANFGLNDLNSGLRHMREAAAVMETLAVTQPQSYLETYAHILNSVTVALYKLERISEAIESARACASAYRQLNKMAGGRFEKALLESLDNLKVLCEQQGETDSAAITAGEINSLQSGNNSI